MMSGSHSLRADATCLLRVPDQLMKMLGGLVLAKVLINCCIILLLYSTTWPDTSRHLSSFSQEFTHPDGVKCAHHILMLITEKTAPHLPASIRELAPGVALGGLTGTTLALLVPSIFVLSSFIRQKVVLAYSGLDKSRVIGPYLDSVVRPEHLWMLLLIFAAICITINGFAIGRLLRRCYKAAATEGAILWAICTYAIWTDYRWAERLFLTLAAVALTAAIASGRIRDDLDTKPLLSSDRPIGKNDDSDDDLDRARLADTLV